MHSVSPLMQLLSLGIATKLQFVFYTGWGLFRTILAQILLLGLSYNHFFCSWSWRQFVQQISWLFCPSFENTEIFFWFHFDFLFLMSVSFPLDSFSAGLGESVNQRGCLELGAIEVPLATASDHVPSLACHSGPGYHSWAIQILLAPGMPQAGSATSK